jgi:hypothetical protein
MFRSGSHHLRPTAVISTLTAGRRGRSPQVEFGPDSLGDSDYFTGGLLGARTRPLAELLEPPIEQGGATLLNKPDLVFLAEHSLGSLIKQQEAG